MRFHLDLLQHMLRIKVVYELRRLGLNAYSFVALIEVLLLLSMLSLICSLTYIKHWQKAYLCWVLVSIGEGGQTQLLSEIMVAKYE